MAKTPLQKYKARKAKTPANMQGIERSTGTPGTSNYVQRSPIQSIGTPGTSKYVQRMPPKPASTPTMKRKPKGKP